MSGISPISITEILAYCDLRSIRCPNQRETLMRAVVAMDQAWREHYGTSGTGT